MTTWILIAVFGGILVIVILAVVIVCTRRHQRKNAKGSPLATRSGSDDVDFAPVAVDRGPPLYDPRYVGLPLGPKVDFQRVGPWFFSCLMLLSLI